MLVVNTPAARQKSPIPGRCDNATAGGVGLFYVQHQFEGIHWAKGKPGNSQVVHREHRRASCAPFVK